MNGTDRVRRAIKGEATDRTPIYGWVAENMTGPIALRYGSVAAFEDRYEFDMAHLFAGPKPFNLAAIGEVKARMGELIPDMPQIRDVFNSPDDPRDYQGLVNDLAFHKKRGRFCYIQTPGFFEQFNELFGIENQLLYMALYPDELNELYRRQAEWTGRFIANCAEIGVDMIHISDDWGSQRGMLFSPQVWRRIIGPHIKRVIDCAHFYGRFASLHSDGYIMPVVSDLAKFGIDLIHPWQESALMSYDAYIDKYADSFAIMGGICVQTAIGVLPRDKLEAEIRRVFRVLKNRRWIACTSHFVQAHCSMDDLDFAYELIYTLARESPQWG